MTIALLLGMLNTYCSWWSGFVEHIDVSLEPKQPIQQASDNWGTLFNHMSMWSNVKGLYSLSS